MLNSLLDPIQVAQTLGNFGTGDVQTTSGALWFLTNGLCENTEHWHPRVFRYYEVNYQSVADGGFYPLTLQEAHFIQSDGVTLLGYVTDLRLGYSVWWQNRKWFSPLLEYYYVPEDQASQHHGLTEDLLSRLDCILAFVESEAERLSGLIKPVRGEVLLDWEGPDRYTIHLLVPCEEVLTRFQSSAEWEHFLRTLFPVTETPRLVYIDTNCEHERGGNPELSNVVGKSYGCSLYDITQAPHLLPDALDDWLRNEAEPLLKEWGPSEPAAIHNARLICSEHNLVPIDPFTRRYLPRRIHMLHS